MENGKAEMEKKICIFKRSSFFADDFPFSIRHVVNRTEEFNESKRFLREFWKITYVIGGQGELIINEQRRSLHPASLILVHPGSVTTYSMATPSMELYNILFDPVFIERDIGTLKDDFQFFSIFSNSFSQEETTPLYILEADHEMGSLIRGMAREYENRSLNYRPLLRLKLLELLILMLRGGERNMRSHDAAKIAEYMNHLLETHFTSGFRLETAAANIGITKNHLCRLYRAQTGKTVIERLKEIRLARAAEELRSTSKSVSEICYSCGFNDLSYFYRAFRDAYAVNPGDYRKKFGQN